MQHSYSLPYKPPILHVVPFLLLTLYSFEIPCCIYQYHVAIRNTNISRQNHLPKQKISSILRHLHYVASLTALHHCYFQNVLYIYIYFVSLYIHFFFSFFTTFYLPFRLLTFKKPFCRQGKHLPLHYVVSIDL